MAEAYQKIGTSTLLSTMAYDPPVGAVVAPPLGLLQVGYAVEDIPTAQHFNSLLQGFGEKINHCLQNGLPLWNATTAYTVGNFVNHTNDGWVCVTGNTNSTPTTANANWVRMTKKSELDAQKTELDAQKTQLDAQNLMMLKLIATPAGLPVSMPTNSTLQINAGFKIPNDARTELIEFASNVTIDLSSGTGLNKLDTGTLTTGLAYYLWIIKNPSTSVVGGLLSLSATSPTLPSGFTIKQLYPVDFQTETVTGNVRLVMKVLTSHTTASFLKPVSVWDANVSNNANAPTVINLSSFFSNNAIIFNASINDTGTTEASASLYMNELTTPQSGPEVLVLESQSGASTATLPIGASKSYKSARANTSGDNSFAICVRDITYKGLQ